MLRWLALPVIALASIAPTTNVRTHAARNPAPPTHIRVIASGTTVLVRWQRPAYRGLRIHLTVAGHTLHPQAGATSARIVNLRAGRTYTILVRACNAHRCSTARRARVHVRASGKQEPAAVGGSTSPQLGGGSTTPQPGGGSTTPKPGGGSTTPPPVPSQFPSASNTGVLAGTVLSAYTGPSTISTANTVIDGKTMGCIDVTAPGVVIRNSKVSCPSSRSGYAVFSRDGGFSGTPLLIEDSEIDCANTNGTALGEALFTAIRVNIHGCENGGDLNQNITIQDSYVHDLYNSAAAHTDGFQMGGGHYVNGQVVAGALNVTFDHNTIFGIGADGSFGTSAIISNRGGDTNILIQNNLLAGGAFTLYCEQGAKGNNYRVISNAFTRAFSQKVGFYGASTDCSDETQSGNIIQETKQPLSLP